MGLAFSVGMHRNTLFLLPVALLLGAAACEDDAAPDPDDFTSIKMFEDGQTVALEGEIEDVYENGMFSMDLEYGISSDEVLVAPEGDRPDVLEEEDKIEVKGRIETMTPPAFKEATGSEWKDEDGNAPRIIRATSVLLYKD